MSIRPKSGSRLSECVRHKNNVVKTAVIGGGAAGSFCAIELKRRMPSSEVVLFEAGPKTLAKVAVTGGGRCNYTNSFASVTDLRDVYPRGAMLMKRALMRFDHNDAIGWFASGGVEPVIQDDDCVFPASQDAMQIVGLLRDRMRRAGVKVLLRKGVEAIRPVGNAYEIDAAGGCCGRFDAVVVTVGGCPKMSDADFLKPLELEYADPVPSLFTFNVSDASLRSLMGLVVEDASLSIPGTGFRSSGPLLLTHWGMSGPAALKLSSYAARHLAQAGYRSKLAVNWMGRSTQQECRAALENLSMAAGRKTVSSAHPSGIPSRLWEHLLSRAGLRPDIRWAELGKNGFNRLTDSLVCDVYEISGKSRWREEFVTCGGVALSNINISTLESKRWPGLYFAGEVLDVDAITGGFNLQAAWSMAYVVAESLSRSL